MSTSATMSKLLPLATTTWDDAEKQAAVDVIMSNQQTMGAKVTEFEQAFATFFGARYAVMVNSGSSANLLALAALRYKQDAPLQPGDEVIVPLVSWSTTYYPINQCELTCVFVDVDSETFNIDVSLVEQAITEKTKAVMVPNILGNPADLPALRALCEQHDLYLIEDNCESMGATVDGQYAGTFGICGTFSTYFSHHISTIEGGMVVTDDEELYHLMLSIRSHGWTRHLPDKNTLVEKQNDFYESFRFILPGYNLRSNEVSAAIGLQQLQKLPSIIAGRRANAEAFVAQFANQDQVQLQQEFAVSTWFGFACVFASEATRDQAVQELADQGVDTRPIIAGNFLRQPVIEHMQYRLHGGQEVADKLHHCGLFIGNHHYDVSQALIKVAELVQEVCA